MLKRVMSVTAAFVLAITVVAASTGSLIISAETNTYTVTFDTSGVVEIPYFNVSLRFCLCCPTGLV